MKRIDASKDGFADIAWSPDSNWIAYVVGKDEVRIANAETGEIRVIGPGYSPGFTKDLSVILERDAEIAKMTGNAAKTLVSKKDLVKDTPKQSPRVSPNGERFVFCVSNVFDKESQQKNAYPYRHFFGIGATASTKPTLTREQWYGGLASWFPDSERFVHFEFDSTGGPQVHVVNVSGAREGTFAGLYPSVSPDGQRLAVRPRSGGSLVAYTSKGSWGNADVETAVMRIPAVRAERNSATPPIWVDNRFVLLDEGDQLWRVDTKRDKAEEIKKLPLPTRRRTPSMIAAPSRERIATEVSTPEGFELRIVSIS
ncbi:MAG: hypothetical protein QNJ97_00205 [Myxococcota bacterium]|nr:hypothetical protein [Myxococcota bacterium]